MEKGNIMQRKLTSFRINKSLQILIGELMNRDGCTKHYIHFQAIKYFYDSTNHHVYPRLLISKSSAPEYVKRDCKEQVYVTEEMQNMLKELADYNQCTLGTVFFHALLIYIADRMEK